MVKILFEAMGVSDQLVIAAKMQELIREVESTIPEFDPASNMYCIERDGAMEKHEEIPDCYPAIVLVSSQSSEQSVVDTSQIPNGVPSEQSNIHPEESAEKKERHYLTSYICRMNHHFINVKFCSSCNLFTPPRAFHCRFCNMYPIGLGS